MRAASTSQLTDGYHELASGKIATVVTYLEMTERPAPRQPVERPDLELRSMRDASLDEYRDLFRRVGTPWLWSSRLVMSAAALGAVLRDPGVVIHALRREGQPIGLLELDRRQDPEIELAFFGLVSEAVGSGAGRWLMQRALDLAFAAAPSRFWVHTCTLDHPAALPFYIRTGFRPYKRAIEIADDPRLTGRLPREAAAWLPLIE